MSTRFAVAVIGRGLFGTAAAKHLAEAGHTVVLIGPGEPVDRSTSQGPFASHYDQGRITRLLGPTLEWSTVGARSIARYADIERRSGIEFYTPSGMAIGLSDIDEWNAVSVGIDESSSNPVAKRVTPDWLRERTGIVFPADMPTAYEGPPAGQINPRALVVAQSRLAEVAGAAVIDGVVLNAAHAAGAIELSGDWGSVQVDRVLVATGAFGAELLDALAGVQVDVSIRPRTHLLIEADADPQLPTGILRPGPDPYLAAVYWTSPVRYPDGRTYLKIGGYPVEDPPLPADSLVDWFRGNGDLAEIAALRASLDVIFPDIAFGSSFSTPCVYTGTPTEHPSIGWVTSDVAIAMGGNGSGAKGSDEIGRLASTLFSDDGWTDSLPHETFAPRLL